LSVAGNQKTNGKLENTYCDSVHMQWKYTGVIDVDGLA